MNWQFPFQGWNIHSGVRSFLIVRRSALTPFTGWLLTRSNRRCFEVCSNRIMAVDCEDLARYGVVLIPPSTAEYFELLADIEYKIAN